MANIVKFTGDKRRKTIIILLNSSKRLKKKWRVKEKHRKVKQIVNKRFRTTKICENEIKQERSEKRMSHI